MYYYGYQGGYGYNSPCSGGAYAYPSYGTIKNITTVIPIITIIVPKSGCLNTNSINISGTIYGKTFIVLLMFLILIK